MHLNPIADEPCHHIVCIVSHVSGVCRLDLEDAGEEVDGLLGCGFGVLQEAIVFVYLPQ